MGHLLRHQSYPLFIDSASVSLPLPFTLQGNDKTEVPLHYLIDAQQFWKLEIFVNGVYK